MKEKQEEMNKLMGEMKLKLLLLIVLSALLGGGITHLVSGC